MDKNLMKCVEHHNCLKQSIYCFERYTNSDSTRHLSCKYKSTTLPRPTSRQH